METGFDVLDLRLRSPVGFGWEVEDEMWSSHLTGSMDEDSPQGHFMLPAGSLVGIEILGVRTLELECDALAHDANGVDCVDQGVNVGL
jgi:hypothetical protein